RPQSSIALAMGSGHLLSWDDFDEKKVNEMFSINLMGPIYTVVEALDDLKKTYGIIINMALE
ncbi:hypothetical protein, partial [Klebsiella aerogenes]|uniref:hypothetical protein n=1 Tax=Klebsiella aerogenes TaxID=548 RepID=UPI001952EB46